jgi:hypothetical protein
VKARQVELDRLHAKAAAAADVEPSHVSDKGSTASGCSMNIRTLARQWGTRLENRGECRFNPLQMDGQIILEDIDGLIAECVEHPLSTKGVKGLPVVRQGHYQYEIELLRDSDLMIGWSGAMTLPGVLDFQGYCYASTGSKWHGQEEVGAYGASFGKKGDVVGALLAWTKAETGEDSLKLSFALNGSLLGVAFEVAINAAPSRYDACVPLQPHVCQLPARGMLKVRLRGGGTGLPLLHPIEGYQPLAVVSDGDFCPFSKAVSVASAERAAAGITTEQLHSFRVPDGHIAELYDIPGGTDEATLTANVACCLGLVQAGSRIVLPMTTVHVRFMGPDAASGTALLACRRPGHVEHLMVRCAESEPALPCSVRPLRHAAASSKEILRMWRGEEFRPHADCSAARRLIHGCLQSSMPLSHLVEEKSRKRSVPKAEVLD